MFAVVVELIWIILIVAFAGACAYPLYNIINPDFLIITLVLAILLAFNFRMVLLFRQIAWLNFLVIQIILFLFNPVLFFKVLGKIQDMIYRFDAFDLLYFTIPRSTAGIYELNNAYQLYRKEFLLFSVGLLILLVLTEFRIFLAFVKRIKEIE